MLTQSFINLDYTDMTLQLKDKGKIVAVTSSEVFNGTKIEDLSNKRLGEIVRLMINSYG